MKIISSKLSILIALSLTLLIGSCQRELAVVKPASKPKPVTASSTNLVEVSDSLQKMMYYNKLASIQMMQNIAFTFDFNTLEVFKDDSLPVHQISVRGVDSFGKNVRLIGIVSDTVNRGFAFVRKRTITDNSVPKITGTEEVFLPNGRKFFTLEYKSGVLEAKVPGEVITDPLPGETDFATWQECWSFYDARLEAEKKADWLLDLACDILPCKLAVGILCALEYILGGIGGSVPCVLCN